MKLIFPRRRRNLWIIPFLTLCLFACNLISLNSAGPTQESFGTTYTPDLGIQPSAPLASPTRTATFPIALFTETNVPTKTERSPETSTPHPTTVVPTSSPTATYSEKLVIGKSVLGSPLEVYRFGTGPTHRMIIAGIHGGAELNTIALADELIQHLQENSDLVPRNITLYYLRSLNPDGEMRTQGPEGRANENGVDLNRNWDALWEAEPDLSGCWASLVLSTGDYPHSEPETQALAAFLLENDIEALISYHSAGQGIYAGGQQPADPDSVRLAQYLSNASGYVYPPIDAGCTYTGQLIDWAAQQGIAAVDVELPNKWENQFDINLKLLNAFLNWVR
jgi:g-D-glutamyl-meso-diaminopimelate peptidase